MNDYDDLVAGIRDPGTLRQVDARGMTPTIAAALDTGSLAHRLMGLLDAPGPADGGERPGPDRGASGRETWSSNGWRTRSWTR